MPKYVLFPSLAMSQVCDCLLLLHGHNLFFDSENQHTIFLGCHLTMTWKSNYNGLRIRLLKINSGFPVGACWASKHAPSSHTEHLSFSAFNGPGLALFPDHRTHSEQQVCEASRPLFTHYLNAEQCISPCVLQFTEKPHKISLKDSTVGRYPFFSNFLDLF